MQLYGMANGTDLTFEQLFLKNLEPELSYFAPYNATYTATRVSHCSDIAVAQAGGKLFLAHNEDSSYPDVNHTVRACKMVNSNVNRFIIILQCPYEGLYQCVRCGQANFFCVHVFGRTSIRCFRVELAYRLYSEFGVPRACAFGRDWSGLYLPPTSRGNYD